ncbi:MAG: hypothetical protein KIS67_26065 [Verrucomicrobiae bacterium]|nr:hypothetical protein [Verrucomicrobiae bacterium]
MTIIRFMVLPMVQLRPMYHDGVGAGTGFFWRCQLNNEVAIPSTSSRLFPVGARREAGMPDARQLVLSKSTLNQELSERL